VTASSARHFAAAVAFIAVSLTAAAAVAAGPAATPGADDAVSRGAYIFAAADCEGCHTDVRGKGPPLAGGRALDTPFGVFYTPNVTPDPATGIGRWSERDFFDAMRHGVGRDDKSLFPAFPYPSFTRMRDQDMGDLFAYLKVQPAVDHPNRPHALDPPFGWRWLLGFWRGLFLDEGPVADNPDKSAPWNRGRYLVDALGHCGECHTRRGVLGAMDPVGYLAGAPRGPEGDAVPGLTPRAKKFAQWTAEDIETYLESGMAPDGDFVGGAMAEVIRNSTSKLTADDRRAIASYLKDLPPHR
jgi:mono/diheme cytochrome c family protein